MSNSQDQVKYPIRVEKYYDAQRQINCKRLLDVKGQVLSLDEVVSYLNEREPPMLGAGRNIFYDFEQTM